MLKIKTDSNNQIDIENKSIEVSDKVSADGAVTITAKAPTEIKIIKATAAKAIVTEKGEIPITLEDAKSVHKVIGILRAPFANSVKQNAGGNGSSETSDEFTYVKTPGTISKLFLHLYEHEDIANSYDDDNALKNQMQVQTVDGYEYIVDADGVIRYDMGQAEYASFSKIVGDDITVVFDIDFTGETNIAEIVNALDDTEGNAAAYQKIVESLTKEDGVSYYGPDDYSCERPINSVSSAKTAIDYAIGNRDIMVLSSDKVFATGWNQDNLDIDNYSSHNIALVIEDHSSNTDSSTGFHGLRIIEKALETGRALDLGICLQRS